MSAEQQQGVGVVGGMVGGVVAVPGAEVRRRRGGEEEGRGERECAGGPQQQPQQQQARRSRPCEQSRLFPSLLAPPTPLLHENIKVGSTVRVSSY